jgi:hypothetical protein
MPYLYGRNNQHGLNGVSRASHNRYLEGRSIHNSDCPNCGGALKIIACPEPSSKGRLFGRLRTGVEDPPVIVKILSHLGLSTRAPPCVPAGRVDLFQTI